MRPTAIASSGCAMDGWRNESYFVSGRMSGQWSVVSSQLLGVALSASTCLARAGAPSVGLKACPVIARPEGPGDPTNPSVKPCKGGTIWPQQIPMCGHRCARFRAWKFHRRLTQGVASLCPGLSHFRLSACKAVRTRALNTYKRDSQQLTTDN
jgi:hypothetical protein